MCLFRADGARRLVGVGSGSGDVRGGCCGEDDGSGVSRLRSDAASSRMERALMGVSIAAEGWGWVWVLRIGDDEYAKAGRGRVEGSEVDVEDVRRDDELRRKSRRRWARARSSSSTTETVDARRPNVRWVAFVAAPVSDSSSA